MKTLKEACPNKKGSKRRHLGRIRKKRRNRKKHENNGKDYRCGTCSECGRIVESVESRLHVTCSCGHKFCYKCGTKRGDDARVHVCPAKDMVPGQKLGLIGARRPGRLRKTTAVTPQTQHVEQEASTVHQHIGHPQTSYQHIGHASCVVIPGYKPASISTRRIGRLRKTTTVTPQTQHNELEASTIHQHIGHARTSHQHIGHANCVVRRDAPPGQKIGLIGLIGNRRTGRLRNSSTEAPQK